MGSERTGRGDGTRKKRRSRVTFVRPSQTKQDWDVGHDDSHVDISEQMIRKARELDPDGDYRLPEDGGFQSLPQGVFDLALSVFTFDNIPGQRRRIELLRGLRELLNGNGRIILFDTTPKLYTNHWASFSTRKFPENRAALTQEVLVRSYFYQTIQSETNFVWAIVISAIFFMAFHTGVYHGSWLPAVNVLVAGVLFGVAYHVTGNLWMPIAIHFTWNFLLGPVFVLAVSGQNHLNSGWQVFALQGPSLWAGGSFGVEGGLVVTLITVIGTAAMFFFSRRSNYNGFCTPGCLFKLGTRVRLSAEVSFSRRRRWPSKPTRQG